MRMKKMMFDDNEYDNDDNEYYNYDNDDDAD